MANFTPNLNLAVTPETTNKSFKTWRLEMDNDVGSNMTKIDDAFGALSSKTTALGITPLATFDDSNGGIPVNSCYVDLPRFPEDVTGQSVDNPVEILKYDSLTLHRTGKNLIDQKELITTSSQTETVNIAWNSGVATITANNAAWALPHIDPITLKAGTTYTLSAYVKVVSLATTGYRPGVCLRRVSNWNIIKLTRLDEGVTEGYVSCTYTPTEDISMYISMVLTGPDKASAEIQFSKIQLEVGGSRTEYESYRGDKWVIDFSDIAPIAQGALYFTTGHLDITRLVRQFDGTEEWRTAGTGASTFFICDDHRAKGTSGRACSHFPNALINSSTTEIGFGFEIHDPTYNLRFRHPTIRTLDEWKAWLRQQANNKTPLTCRYALATTLRYNIPLNFLKTLKGVNYVWLDEGDVNMRIGGSISSLQNEIDTLGRRVNDINSLVEALNELSS